MIRIAARTSPLETNAVYCEVEAGMSLLEILGGSYEGLFISVNDVPIPAEAWASTFPEDGEIVAIVRVPGTFGIVEGIVAAAVAAAQAAGSAALAVGSVLGGGIGGAAMGAMGFSMGLGATIGAAAINLGLGVGMSMAIGALVKPQTQSPGMPFSNRYAALSGGQNQVNQYGPVPKLYGTFSMLPPVAANYFTTTATRKTGGIVGGSTNVDPVTTTETLHVLLCLGYGPLEFTLKGKQTGVTNTVTIGPPEINKEATSFLQIIEGGVSDRLNDDDLDSNALLIGSTSVNMYTGARYQIGTVDAIINSGNYDPRTGKLGTSGNKKFSKLYTNYKDDVINNDGTIKKDFLGARQVSVENFNTPLNISLTPAIVAKASENNAQWFKESDDYGNFTTVIRTTAPNPDKVRVYLQFPQGIYGKVNNSENALSIRFLLSYRRTGSSGTWKNASVVWQDNDISLTPQNVGSPSGWYDYNWQILNFAKAPVKFFAMFPIEDSKDTPVGQKYDIRLQRVATSLTKFLGNHAWECNWVEMQTIRDNEAWNTVDDYLETKDNIILLALRMQASQSLSGSLPPVHVNARSVVRVVTTDPTAPGTVSTAGRRPDDPVSSWKASANPAWVYLDMLQGIHLKEKQRVSDDRIDWPALLAWADWCDYAHIPDIPDDATEAVSTIGRRPPPGGRTIPAGVPRDTTYNWYHTEAETLLERLRAVTSCGRAAWALIDGKFSVTRDYNYTPVQMITPRNSWGFEMSKGYPKVPNALRVRYVTQSDWSQDERIVLDDYYYTEVRKADGTVRFEDAFGRDLKDPATWGDDPPPGGTEAEIKAHWKLPETYETLETQGVIDQFEAPSTAYPKGRYVANQAFREGRYYLGVMRLRRETYKVNMDIENLVATRGDCVYLSQECMLVSRAAGRIAQITSDTEIRTDILVDLTPEDGVTFCIRVRRDDSSTVVVELAPGAGKTYTLTLAEPITTIKEGDLFVFGTMGTETLLAKVTDIQYQSDLSAALTLVPAAPGLATADVGKIEGELPIDDGGVDPWEPPTNLPTDPPNAPILKVAETAPETTVGSLGIAHSMGGTAVDDKAAQITTTWEVTDPSARTQGYTYSVEVVATPYLDPNDTGAGLDTEAQVVQLWQVAAQYMATVYGKLDLGLFELPGSNTIVSVTWFLDIEDAAGLEIDITILKYNNPDDISDGYTTLVSATTAADAFTYSVDTGVVVPSKTKLQIIANIRSVNGTTYPLAYKLMSVRDMTRGQNDLSSILSQEFADGTLVKVYTRAYDALGLVSADSNSIDVLIGAGEVPTPIPIPHSLTLIPDNWQISLDWRQPWELEDTDPAYLPKPASFLGTEIFWSYDPDFAAVNELSVPLVEKIPKAMTSGVCTLLQLDGNTMYYFWIRNISEDGVVSNLYPDRTLPGMAGTPGVDMTKYFELMDDWMTLHP